MPLLEIGSKFARNCCTYHAPLPRRCLLRFEYFFYAATTFTNQRGPIWRHQSTFLATLILLITYALSDVIDRALIDFVKDNVRDWLQRNILLGPFYLLILQSPALPAFLALSSPSVCERWSHWFKGFTLANPTWLCCNILNFTLTAMP